MSLTRALSWLLTPLLPIWVLVLALNKRTRRDLKERLGFLSVPVSQDSIWIHASSVGEISGALNMARLLDGPILITADTDTGVRAARAYAQTTAGRVVAMVKPIDHPLTLARVVSDCRPRALFFVESVWWPALAACVSAGNTPIMQVSAKSGPATRRLAYFGLYRHLTAASETVFARSDADAQWFSKHSNAEVLTSVDIKLSRPAIDPCLTLSSPYVVAASTRGEEESLIDVAKLWQEEGRAWLLVIAPRHPERFEAVTALLHTAGLEWKARSACVGDVVPTNVQVLLMDSVGELSSLIGGAEAVYVGGTFDKEVGGHSPAEAYAAGVGVVAGPCRMSNHETFERSQFIAVSEKADLAEGLVRASQLTSDAMGFDKDLLRSQLMERCRTGLAEPTSPRPWALPIVPIWAIVSVIRHWLYDRNLLPTTRLKIPVVSVGSTNARGSGKTPAAIMIAQALRQRGHSVGVAVRGYRRVARGAHVSLSTDSMSASQLGDEGAVIASRGFLVAAGPRRVATARALEEAGVTVVVFEDGLSHRKLYRDVDIVIVDARNMQARGLIPAGERRELHALPERVDGVLCQYATADTLPRGAIPVKRLAGVWHHGDVEIPKGPSGDVALVLGVGRPDDFVRELGLNIRRSRIFADHAPISESAAQEILTWASGLPIVCTGKDRVRLPPCLFDRVWWRDVDMVADALPESWFSFSPSAEVPAE